MTWRQGNVQSIGVDELSGAPKGVEEVVWTDPPMYIVAGFPPANPSGIHPTEFRVLVLPAKVDEKTKGGIILPDEKKERDQYAVMEATIIECSPLAFTYESNWPENAHKPKAGDRVVIAKYSGALIKGKDGQEYKLIADKDIAAVLE